MKQFISHFLAGIIALYFISLFACQRTSAPEKVAKAKIEVKPKIKKSLIVKTTKTAKNMDSSDVILTYLSESLQDLLQKSQQGEALKIICYGNSITNGYKVGSFGRVALPYPKKLEKLLQKNWQNPKINIINEGHNGWRSDQALANLERLILRKKPQLVSLMFGINDAYSNFSEALYLQKMQGIVKHLQEAGIEVLLLTPTFINTPYQPKVRTFSKALSKWASKANVSFIDIGGHLNVRTQKAQIKAKELLPDDVHFADKYYAWIGEIIAEELSF